MITMNWMSARERQQYVNNLLVISKSQPSLVGILKELADNASDAGATKIIIFLEANRIVVSDNGHGMNPVILPEDWKLLRSFWEDVEAKRRDFKFDVRQLISLPSRRSMEWLANFTAWSGKVPEAGANMRGLRGVGAQNARQLGDHIEWVSLPSEDILPDPQGPRKAYRLVIPSDDQLLEDKIEPLLEEYTGRVLDAQGKPMTSGTVVAITNLKPGIANSLRPRAIGESLRTKFGPQLRSGKLEIYVVDKVSEDGRKAPHGLATKIMPPVYTGYNIIDDYFKCSADLPSFRSEIWYNPQGRPMGADDEVQILRGEAPAGTIRNIEEFESLPLFRDGKIQGTISFLDVPESQVPWEINKSVPLAGDITNRWIRTIREQIIPRIEEAIAEIEERARLEKVTEAASAVASATLDAMKELDEFRELTPGTPKREPTTGKQRKKRERRDTTRDLLIVTVLDEYNNPLTGITIELHSKGQLLRQEDTGTRGKVSFGQREFGRYTVKIVVPEGMTPEHSVTEHTFNLGPNQLGTTILFRLLTGREKPEQKQMARSLTVYPHPLPDPDQLYSADMTDVGLVQINSEHPDYRAAIEAGDTIRINILTVQAVASAVTEFFLSDLPPAQQLQAASRLFARVLSSIETTPRRR